MLIKRTQPLARRGAFGAMPEQRSSEHDIDRRGFLRRSGLVAGSLAAVGTLPLANLRRAEAGAPPGVSTTLRPPRLCIFKGTRTVMLVAVLEASMRCLSGRCGGLASEPGIVVTFKCVLILGATTPPPE